MNSNLQMVNFVYFDSDISWKSLMSCTLLIVMLMMSLSTAVETTTDPTASSVIEESKLSASENVTVWTSSTSDTVANRTRTSSVIEESKLITSENVTVWTSSTSDTVVNSTASSLNESTTAAATSQEITSMLGSRSDISAVASTFLKPVVKDDFVMIEMVRLVFQGNLRTSGFANKVYGLLESFLTRAARELKAVDGSDWSYELSSNLRAKNFENKTYVDFRIKHTTQQEISFVFNRLEIRRFIAHNSNLVLLAECWPSLNCQNGSRSGVHGPSVLEKNVSMFTAVVVLCSLCLVVMVTGVMCSCLKRMKIAKTDKNVKNKTLSDDLQHVTTSPASSDQVQVAGQEKDDVSHANETEGNNHCTWVIPLDKAPGKYGRVVIVTAEDTSL